MSSIFERDFLVVVGKGGVGKTVTSAALALRAASLGKRVLLAQCNAKDPLASALKVDPLGPRNQEILPNIDAVNMNPEVAIEEYGMMILRVRALYRAVFENRISRAFLKGIPGMDAWSMLGKAYHHATRDTDALGRKKYDLVILDAPATGHGIHMLRVPEVIADVAPPGLLRKEAEQALALLRDKDRTGIVLVTLAEEMPVMETYELHRVLRDELSLHEVAVVVNRVLTPIFHEGEDRELATLAKRPDLSSHKGVEAVLRGASERLLREQSQQSSLARLKPLTESGIPMIQLSEVEGPGLCRNDLQRMAEQL